PRDPRRRRGPPRAGLTRRRRLLFLSRRLLRSDPVLAALGGVRPAVGAWAERLLTRLGGHPRGGRLAPVPGRVLPAGPTAPPATPPAPPLGEVPEQLTRQRRRLAGHARSRPAQHLLGLGRVR